VLCIGTLWFVVLYVPDVFTASNCKVELKIERNKNIYNVNASVVHFLTFPVCSAFFFIFRRRITQRKVFNSVLLCFNIYDMAHYMFAAKCKDVGKLCV
jgi:uncharacterized membrane protein YwaF